jgi:hypothetical protein
MVFGKSAGEYVAFAKVFLILIPIAGIIRLALSLSGEPNSSVKWISMTALVWIGTIYYAIRVPTTHFGSYKQLLAICFLLNVSAQAIIVFGIILAIVTGTNNIFSSPEYAFGSDGKTWLHVGAHALIGTTAGSLVPWLFGSVVLAITRKVSTPGQVHAKV